MATILIVDDSKVPRLLLRRLLEPCGHEVREAVDSVSTLACYAASRPDVVLLDLILGEECGLDVLARLRESDANVCVVMATGDAEERTRHRAVAAGARGFLTKPFVREEVLRVLGDVLGTAPSG